MTRRAVVPAILEVLEPWLEGIEKEYAAQPPTELRPTLPLTPDGKVNVVAIVRELKLKPADQKWFHTKPEIRDLVNSFAESQGVKPIGSRTQLDQVDDVVRQKVKRLGGDARRAQSDLTEAQRQIEFLTAKLEKVVVERNRYRSALREIYSSGDLPAPVVDEVIK